MRWGNESERRKSKKLIADVELKDNNWLRRHFGVKTMTCGKMIFQCVRLASFMNLHE